MCQDLFLPVSLYLPLFTVDSTIHQLHHQLSALRTLPLEGEEEGKKRVAGGGRQGGERNNLSVYNFMLGGPHVRTCGVLEYCTETVLDSMKHVTLQMWREFYLEIG